MTSATIRVAAYCRVSTDASDQHNSFASQQRFFGAYIQNREDWELYAIYADEGITGTSTKKRIQFNRMIQDAKNGKFHIIITKEVSRFSRNLLDTIKYTRELQEKGISVIFLTDGIDTRDPDSELRLSIMASIAQEESRRTSARVTWGQTRQMEKGVVFGRSLLGYQVVNGQLIVNPEEAYIVQRIFRAYAIEGKGTTAIAAELESKQMLTARGNVHWTSCTILRILKNEKYVGDLVQKKTYTPNYLTHEKKENRGAVPMIYLRDHHPPIIERTLWEMTQQRLTESSGQKGPAQQYPFSRKIRCGCCGKYFAARKKYRKDGSFYLRWCCLGNCGVGRILRNDDAVEMIHAALQALPFDQMKLINNCTELLKKQHACNQSEIITLRQKQVRIEEMRISVLEHYFSGKISERDRDTLLARYENQLALLENRIGDSGTKISIEQQMLRTHLSDVFAGKERSETLCAALLDSITVFQDRHLEVRLKELDGVFYFA